MLGLGFKRYQVSVLGYSYILYTFKIISLTNFNAQFSIHQQYVCYTIILDMFRALICPSSGGQIVFTQHLVSSLSVNGCTVHRLRADSQSRLSTGVLCSWSSRLHTVNFTGILNIYCHITTMDDNTF